MALARVKASDDVVTIGATLAQLDCLLGSVDVTLSDTVLEEIDAAHWRTPCHFDGFCAQPLHWADSLLVGRHGAASYGR